MFNIQGNIIRDTERYIVEDNTRLEGLTVSKTILHAKQQTTGHSHKDSDEVYLFTHGYGLLKMDDKLTRLVSPGAVILIPRGIFHQVINTDNEPLVFVSVFNPYLGRESKSQVS